MDATLVMSLAQDPKSGLDMDSSKREHVRNLTSLLGMATGWVRIG
jgi:hypothetical protein